MSYYHIIYTIFLSFSALTSIVVTSQRSKYKHTPLIIAPIILWLGFFSEGIGFIYGTYVTFDNGWIYNTSNILIFSLFYLMMYRYIKSTRLKKLVCILSFLGIGFYVFRFLTAQSFNIRLSIAHCIAVFILLIICVIYISQVLRSNDTFNLRVRPEFIFIGGNLIINLIYAPIYVASDLNLHIFSRTFYTYVSSMHSYAYMAINLFFIIGFIWTKKAKI